MKMSLFALTLMTLIVLLALKAGEAMTLFIVSVSILFATLLASLLILLFMLVGQLYALDQRVFPTVTAGQKATFGLIGFWVLVLSGLEFLNPVFVSYDIRKTPVEKPYVYSYLTSDVFPTVLPGLTWQNLVSICVLGVYVGFFLVTTYRLSTGVQPERSFRRLMSRLKSRLAAWLEPGDHRSVGIPPGGTPAPNGSETQSQNAAKPDDKLKERASGLSFAFNFSFMSLLIALLAPQLAKPIQELPQASPFQLLLGNFGNIVVYGVLLISGVYCFIEALGLGSWIEQQRGSRRKFWLWVITRVLGKGIFWYVVVGTVGFVLYDGQLLNGLIKELSGKSDVYQSALIKTGTKFLAGAFIILAGYLVAWGRDGLKARLWKFMVVVSSAPLVFPLWQLVWSIIISVGQLKWPETDPADPTNPSMIVYSLGLVVATLGLFRWSQAEDEGRRKTYRVAFVRDAAWAIFTAGGIKDNIDFDCQGYMTSEELLEVVIGGAARRGAASPARHRIATFLGLHRDFDAIIIDLVSAIRLIDAVTGQGRHRKGSETGNPYFIVAGVCRSTDRYFHIANQQSGEARPTALPGPAYLPGNLTLNDKMKAAINLAVSPDTIGSVMTLPPNCIADYFPNRLGTVVVPEPFATAAAARFKSDENLSVTGRKLDQANEAWLFDRYDVLVVRDLGANEGSDRLIAVMEKGVRELRPLGGVVIEEALEESIARELDPSSEDDPGRSTALLDARSIADARQNIKLDGVAIIDANDPRGQTNWKYAQTVIKKLCESRVVKMDQQLLEERLQMGTIRADKYKSAHTGSLPGGKTQPDATEISLLAVADETGSLNSTLDGIRELGINLGVLVASRTGRGRGVVYLVPKSQKDMDRLKNLESKIRVVLDCWPIRALQPFLIGDEVGSLATALDVLKNADINIRFCFALARGDGRAVAVVGLEDEAKAATAREILEGRVQFISLDLLF